jgi:predicted  nucleic acid-binding Zn-ribbon protein
MPILPKEGIEIPKGQLRRIPSPPLPPSPRIIPKPEKRAGPALFIKIEKYDSVVENLNKFKDYAKDLKTKLNLLENVHRQLQSTIDDIQKLLDSINLTITNLNSLLYRPVEQVSQTSELESYAKDFYKQIEKIRSDLKTI